MASAIEKARDMNEDQAKELVDFMTSKMALRRVFELAQVDRKTLERILTKVTDFEQEITAQEEANRERQLTVDKNKEEAMAVLAQMGISPEDLIKKPRKKRTTNSSKQKNTEKQGEEA